MERENVPAIAHQILDQPFYFLLDIPGYEPTQLAHDADMFSGWGGLILEKRGGEQFTRAAIRERLLQAATKSGWAAVEELPNIDPPKDLKQHGVTHAKEDLNIAKNVGQSKPTRYSCQIWISDDAHTILTSYRVDGN